MKELSTLPSKEVGEKYWDNGVYLVNTFIFNHDLVGCKSAGHVDCVDFAVKAMERTLSSMRKGSTTDVQKWGEVHKVNSMITITLQK